MFLEILKKDSKETYNFSGDPMISLIILYREGLIYADYENFLKYLNDQSLPILTFDLLEIEKLNDDKLKLCNCYHPDEDVLIAQKSEFFKIIDMVMDLTDKEWEKIYIAFDGTTFNIQVDDKEYLNTK
jgi:hypothetical protein